MSPNPESISVSPKREGTRSLLDQCWQTFARVRAEIETPLLRKGLKPAGILVDTDDDSRVYCHPLGRKGIRDLRALGGYGWGEERDVEYGYEADLIVNWGEKAGIIRYSSFEGHTPKLVPSDHFFQLHDGYYSYYSDAGVYALVQLSLSRPAFVYRAGLKDVYAFTQLSRRQILDPKFGALQILQNIEQGLINASQHKAEDL